MKHRIACLLLALVMVLSLLPMSASAAEIFIRTTRYDGVMVPAYENQWSTYAVEVVNAPAGAEISYHWELNVVCAIGDADDDYTVFNWHIGWKDANKAPNSWVIAGNRNFIQVFNQQGCSRKDELSRFVFRCIVTVNGKEYKSQNFVQFAEEPQYVGTLAISGLSKPSTGYTPDFTASLDSETFWIDDIAWYRRENGESISMGQNDRFASNGSYRVCVRVKTPSVYFLNDYSRASIGGSPCKLTADTEDPTIFRVSCDYEIVNGKVIRNTYSYVLEGMLGFDDDRSMPAFLSGEDTEHWYICPGKSVTLEFPATELPQEAISDGYSTTVIYQVAENGSSQAGTGSSVTVTGKTVGSDIIVKASVVLMKNNKAVEGATLSRTIIVHVVESAPPQFYRLSNPRERYYRKGDTVLLFAYASSPYGDVTYQWQYYETTTNRYGETVSRWVPLALSTGPMLTISNADESWSGTRIRCRATNSFGSTLSREFTLYLYETDINAVTVNDLSTAVAGRVLSEYATVPADADYTLESVTWYTSGTRAANTSTVANFMNTATPVTPGSTAQSGNVYYAAVIVTAKEGATFFSSSLPVTVNGKTLRPLYVMPTSMAVLVPCSLASQACSGKKSDCPSYHFLDAPRYGTWAHPGVDFVLDRGLFSGVSSTRFAPNNAMNRAMLVSVLYRYAGEPSVSGLNCPFTDVPAGWYYNAVIWASANGIVSGTGAGKFSPNTYVTREQLATFLYRFAGYLRLDTSVQGMLQGYLDVGKVSSFAVQPMLWAVQNGVISGTKQGAQMFLAPTQNTTRAEVALMLMQFVQKVAEK